MVKLKKGMKGTAKLKPPKDETEEERLIRLEMEALAAEEKGRLAEEQARVAFRERQLREQKYAHINGIKIHNQWRKIMRMAKVEELRKDIEILSQNHEREVDRKDAIIQLLDRDLEEAEEQYGMAVRVHLATVDSLLDLQYQRVRSLHHHFTTSLRSLEEEFDLERTEIINSHNRQKKDMHDIMAAMEQEFADAEGDSRQEFESQREEIKNRNSEEYNVLKIQLEGIIEELERHFEQAHKAYMESTEHRTAAFRQLTRNDAQAARIIEKRMKKLARLQEALLHWRTKIATNSREWEERNRSLRAEKDIMNRHYQVLKRSMDAFRAGQADRLKQLAQDAAGAMADIKAKLGRATAILKQAELCRQYETEQEKVLPFLSPADGLGLDLDAAAEAQAAADAAVAAAEEGVEELGADTLLQGQEASDAGKVHVSSYGLDPKGREVAEFDYLNRFFQRYNKAVLDKSAIDRERTRLERENSDLRAILKQYLDGISVSADVLNNPLNPLLIVNQRLQLTLAERARARTNAAAAAARGAEGAPQQAQPQLVVVNARSG